MPRQLSPRADILRLAALYGPSTNLDSTTFASLNMGLVPSFRSDIVAFLNPALCANTEQTADNKESLCQNAASLVCVCKLVQVCCLLFSNDASLRLVLRQEIPTSCIILTF